MKESNKPRDLLTDPAAVSSKSDKDWLDVTSKLLLPVIMAFLGLWIPYKTFSAPSAVLAARI